MGITEQVKNGPSPATGYDWVKSLSADGIESVWTRAQFEGLNLLERVRLLAGGHLRFFREGGEEVSARSALSRD